VQSLTIVAVVAAISGYFLFRTTTRINRTITPGAHAESGSSDVAWVYTPDQKSRLAGHRRSLDPNQNGWRAEALSEAAEERIKTVAKLWTKLDSIDLDQVRPLIADDFHCSVLRPSDLEEVYRDTSISIFRPVGGLDDFASDRFHALTGVAAALRDLAQPLSQASRRRAKVKTVAIEDAKSAFTTVHLLEASGQTAGGTVEQHARWSCEWTSKPGEAPKLRSIRLTDYEEVVANTPHKTWFTDCTEAVVGHNPTFRAQLAYGLNHWLARIESNHGMYVFAEYGIALGDVNGDGLDDVYVCQPAGLPNRLLVQNMDGTVTDRSESAGVDWLDHTSSALLVDLDNDGDQDLILALAYHLLLMGNNSRGQFQLQAKVSLVDRHVQSLSAVDYDADGDLDLYITVGFADEEARANEDRSPFVYYDANEGGANALLRNDSSSDKWQFEDVTREVGLDVRNRRHSLAASWEDYDNDGDQDLYVANDYGQNCLYRNDSGEFVEIAASAGVVDFGSGMSVSWSDYDRDGHMDLHVGNMFSSAGSRITRQDAFQGDASPATREIFTRFAKGNTLFHNLSDGTFRDVGSEAAVEMGRWAWSSIFADLNNDGWDDLVVANGYLTTEDTGDL